MPDTTALFHLEIVTPEKVVFSGEAQYISVPGSEGELGVLEGHAPLLTLIAPGEIHVMLQSGDEWFAIGGGILEVSNNVVTIAAETAEAAADIDTDRALKAHEIAQERLAKAKEDSDVDAAQKLLLREEARIKVAQHVANHAETASKPA